jgi:pyruvate/2-oxoglutarate dehydrogenase complex dihydrolipoamide dehydrogenase (E3) component
MPLFFSLAVLCAAAAPSYDLLVIGGGSAGLTAAKFAARFGKSVAIIEKAKMGGDCTWTGCVPSKTLIASAGAAHSARTAAAFGVSTSSVTADMKAIKARLGRVIGEIYDADDSPEALRALGIDTFSGAATLIDRSTVRVESTGGASQEYTARKGIVVATGARPRVPDISGIDGVKYLTYEEIFDLDTLPSSLTVVGGGPIGCELAQAFARLGAKVTLVARALLPGHEPEASADLQTAMRADGVTLVPSRGASVEAVGSEAHKLTCDDGTVVDGTALLVATGRVPVVDSLGLDEVGVALSAKGGIQVDSRLRTSLKGVYAAGDCTGDQQFTHYAGFQGAIAARNVLLPLSDPGVVESRVPACVFTAPELGRVGLTEGQARAADPSGKGVAIAIRRMSRVDRAITTGDAGIGFIKVVYAPKDGTILGATVMGPSACELISEFAVAMAGRVKLPALASVMHAYPTVSIAIQQLAAEVYYDQLEASMPLYNVLSKLGL